MKELYIVRHGEAEHLLNGLGGGWVETPLTDLGRIQSRQAGIRLKELIRDNKFDIYSSDLSRAYETASIIGEILGRQPVVSTLIRGLSLGVAGAMQKEEADLVKNPITLPLFDWIPYQGAESLEMMQERVNCFMEELYKDGDGIKILVLHGNSGVSVLYWWLEIGRELLTKLTKPSFQLDPCSLTHVVKDKVGKPGIVKINDTSHIRKDKSPNRG